MRVSHALPAGVYCDSACNGTKIAAGAGGLQTGIAIGPPQPYLRTFVQARMDALRLSNRNSNHGLHDDWTST